MTILPGRLLPILCFAVVSCLTAAPALALVPAAQRYSIFQDGYAEGATVSGAFTGSDLDGNGILVHFPLAAGQPAPPIQFVELTAFSMHFSGNSRSPAFDLGLGDLYGFVYQLGTAGIGDDPAHDPTLNADLVEGIGAIGAVRFYTSGLGPNGFIGGYVGGQIDLNTIPDFGNAALDSSQHLVLVTPVPEPAAGVMMIMTALVAQFVRRRA
jgi:hypothetical protein